MSTETAAPDSAEPPVPDRVPWQRQAWAFAERHLRVLVRSPMIIFLAVGWPLAWYVLTVSVFLPGDAGAFALGSVAVSYAFFGSFTVVVAVFAGAFAGDLDGGRYRKFRSLPIAPSADLAGRFVAALVLAVFSHAVVLAVAFATGARFEPRLAAIGLVPLTLLSFCVVAVALSLVLGAVVSKPEYMTTIGIVLALIAYYTTGFNGTQPGMIADDPWFVNVLPNSLATRQQLYALFDGDFTDTGVLPPELPSGIEFVGLTGAYVVVGLAVSILLVRRVAYGGDPL
ncbi:ABC transporter permease [Salinarchaeum laminariae]|uniref:ABC transporter permease n=1 Tax=Salinarchaeum laminariae TaxID=869888 RepID=UPI0020BD7979|nr:ABC transporter permease [Salinarchaeum laminariae]